MTLAGLELHASSVPHTPYISPRSPSMALYVSYIYRCMEYARNRSLATEPRGLSTRSWRGSAIPRPSPGHPQTPLPPAGLSCLTDAVPVTRALHQRDYNQQASSARRVSFLADKRSLGQLALPPPAHYYCFHTPSLPCSHLNSYRTI